MLATNPSPSRGQAHGAMSAGVRHARSVEHPGGAGRTLMLHRSSIVIALAAALTVTAAQASDESKYPDFKGQWHRVGAPGWVVPGGSPPPVTPEYQAVFEANKAEMAAGGMGNVPSWYCLPQGMPMMMNIYDPMEVIVAPGATYILISHINDSYRRIYTDGRDWPENPQAAFAAYSVRRRIGHGAEDP